MGSVGAVQGQETVKRSPHIREEVLADAAREFPPGLIEPFLSEALVVDEGALDAAPRIVAGQDHRVLLARGDRAYARGAPGTPLLASTGSSPKFRLFRTTRPLVDPVTGAVLGHEARYVGEARLLHGESVGQTGDAVPAILDIVDAREEIRVGDRLLPQSPQPWTRYTPHVPQRAIEAGRIVSIDGDAKAFAAQHQVVTINKGLRDGIDNGHVLAIRHQGETLQDLSEGTGGVLQFPKERIGVLMVFRPFERVSYALVLEITDAPRVGDEVALP